MENINPSILPYLFNEGIYDFTPATPMYASEAEEKAPLQPTQVAEPATSINQKTQTAPLETSNFAFAREGNPALGVALFFNPNSKSSSEDKDFLVKILAAVKTDIRETFICMQAGNETYEEVCKRLKVKKAIFWGISPFEVGIKDEKFNRYELGLYNKAFVLHVDELKVIAKSQEKKAALWEALKRMFF